ncbi:6-phosphogluconate dehydrogenase C-terminal domain-like protein [Didymella exigua CBS 183.55]|uniref:6-phosphogluconate dehydrogenase C-terminal domain-like protein n=1 Tax=Didymella exigua CBS 183.55 TaxID=1150837 RepID=A0A6A5S270_9PLEO|nr:6-phosphogluconate dehydrogenase C-terminal domain-like protein [Didymella exigua CBS 183.55]KAF1934003.1 6-phosphogluconate dehydrogenase C-terminal domain-like protein [Didymella exigua CBS 183.55]
MTTSLATVAVISIGQMGLGVASLLLAHDFRVITNVSDRSAATQERATSAGIQLLSSDEDVVREADYILSIVPPAAAPATALRFVRALTRAPRDRKAHDLWFLDLNAGSPDAAVALQDLFARDAPSVRFVDGGIIGAPPARRDDGSWARPGVALAGPHALSAASEHGARLAAVLDARHLGPAVGTASGLKACFAALSKGFTALALQSYTTAASLGVLPELRRYLDVYNPGAREKAERGIVGCTTKAYRWVGEMHGIGDTFAVQGRFGAQASVFREIAGVYEGLAEVVERQGTSGLDDAEAVVGKLGEHMRQRRRSV